MDKWSVRKKRFVTGICRKRPLAGTIAIVASVALAPGVSWALDYCFEFPAAPTAYIQIGVGFKIPGAGECKNWVGFTPQNDANSPSAGTGCTSSDGSNFTLNLTTQEAGFLIFDSISVPLPARKRGGTTGTSTEEISQNQPGIDAFAPFSVPVNGMKCIARSNPIPGGAAAQDASMEVGSMHR
jgi:hypothetical protein